MPDKPRIFFRADGNSRIGLGHVVRSLALAEMLQPDYKMVFAIQQPEESLEQKISQTCTDVIVLPQTQDYLQEAEQLANEHLKPEDVVVLDGYSFNATYQQVIKNKGGSVLCIDDIHAYPFVADAVVNMAGGVQPTLYQLAPYTKLYTGPAYALLREPFRKAAQQQQRPMPTGPLRLLLCLGGSDPENHTLRLAQEILNQFNTIHLEIVVGSACLHVQELEQWLQDLPNCTLHRNLEASELCRLMQRCQLAVTSASGVAYEYCAAGGILFVLRTAANQGGFYQFLLHDKLAFSYEELPVVLAQPDAHTLFQDQLARQRQYFSGASTERYKQIFQSLSLSACLQLREAGEQDLQLLFDWANDPEVRSRSFNSDPIPMDQHQKWFKAKLANPKSRLYIAEAAGKPVAQIRFEQTGSSTLLSYLISSDFRGKGLGHVVLLKGIQLLKDQRPDVTEVTGLVQADNIASVRAFEKAGFSLTAPDTSHADALRFLLRWN